MKAPRNRIIHNKQIIHMEKYNTNITSLDMSSWAHALEGIKYTFKGWVKEVVEETISEKMCNVNLEDKRLSVTELCARWNISRSTLRNWENNGIIQSLSIGGRRKLYSMVDVHNAEEEGLIKTIY